MRIIKQRGEQPPIEIDIDLEGIFLDELTPPLQVFLLKPGLQEKIRHNGETLMSVKEFFLLMLAGRNCFSSHALGEKGTINHQMRIQTIVNGQPEEFVF